MKIDELQSLLKELRFYIREKQKTKWDRSLPFEEELFDRWERSDFLGFGESTNIYQSSLVFGDVKVGKDTWVGPFTILDGSGGLTIGDNCSISSGVQIYTHDTILKRVSDGKIKSTREKTSIGNSCYIGPLSVIKKGVRIENNAIVAAHSYVNMDVASYTIVGGTPAKKIGEIIKDNQGNISFKFEKTRTESEEKEKQIEELKKRVSDLERTISSLIHKP